MESYLYFQLFLGFMYRGTKVQLGPLERKHLSENVKWLNDPEVTKYLRFFEPIDIEGEQRWYEDLLKDNSRKVYAIKIVDGEYIGNLQLSNINLHDRKAELGILIGEKNLWGKGYGTEAVQLALRLAFEGLNLNRVYLKTLTSNKRARRCYEKAGFKEEGILRQDGFCKGRYVDRVMYSILAEEYFKRKKT